MWYVTGVVRIANNTFSNNTIIATNGSIATWQSALVGIRFSHVDVFNNKFLSNKTGAVIGVNQWQGASGTSTGTNAEVRFFGNLFNANSIYGPLLHLFALPRMRFVNNSVINNSFYGHIDANNNGSPDSDTQYDGYFIYGVDTSAFGDIGSRQVEIHNNLFYNNGSVSLGLVSNQNLSIGCEPIRHLRH